MPRYPQFLGGSNMLGSLISDCERTVNLFLERSQSRGAQSEGSLFPTPGYTQLAQVADVGGRASIFADGRLFKILAGGLYEFDQNFVATLRGNVATDANPAIMVYNSFSGQIGITSGGSLYCFTLATNVLSAALLAGGYTHIGVSATYGLALNPTTRRVVLSNLNDLSTWTGVNYFTRTTFPDPWQALFVDTNGLVWLPGKENFDVWSFANASNTQPFAPLPALVGRFGIAAPFAYAVTGFGAFWLASTPEGVGRMIRASGQVPEVVSTYAFNIAVSRYLRTSRIDTAELVAYEADGHTFINVNFPTANATWSFDPDGGWAERGLWSSVRGDYDIWPVRTHCVAFGKNVVTDRSTGRIWALDATVATDVDGNGIRRLRRPPGITNEHRRLPINRLELLMETGLGLPSGQGSNPVAMLRVSSNGGKTYGNERQASVGRQGEYARRVAWTRLGTPEYFVPEVTFSDPIPFRVTDAWINNRERAA